MKIAVTSQNGSVFQHFGRAPEFAVFDAEDGKITGAEVISCGGSGHGALAGLLGDKKIDVLICGGIGAGAVAALSELGIINNRFTLNATYGKDYPSDNGFYCHIKASGSQNLGNNSRSVE